jgi:tetratricopeptide (TPR) repeat protein
MASNDVFISYRRDVSGTLALALHQFLTLRGIDVFYDIESIKAGQFDTIILGQIEARPYFILILTPGTLDRCVEPEDWVRREIEQALRYDRIIIPAFTPQFDFADFRRFLPDALASELSRFNGQEIPQRWFKYAVDELAKQYLVPVELSVAVTPPQAKVVVEWLKAEARAEPRVTVESLTASESFERAYTRQSQGDIEGAIADYDEAIRRNPNHASAFNNRAITRSDQGDVEGAMADYDEAIRLDPNDADAFNNRGATRYDQGDVEGAKADFKASRALGP